MSRPTTAEEIKNALSNMEMEKQFHIEKKGWKMRYAPLGVLTAYWEKEIDGKHYMLTLADAFAYELKQEESTGYEY